MHKSLPCLFPTCYDVVQVTDQSGRVPPALLRFGTFCLEKTISLHSAKGLLF
ncbi:Putative axial regulator YABBY 2 [Zea mays]|uniref:Putative axial regulator YABBY 2 n=1 Tax=Zea mays TaxID=4577 RepID=A0A1D6KGI7_MAIZE|nr:Putative axial regulator YABBY 2 [Zea mays]